MSRQNDVTVSSRAPRIRTVGRGTQQLLSCVECFNVIACAAIMLCVVTFRLVKTAFSLENASGPELAF